MPRLDPRPAGSALQESSRHGRGAVFQGACFDRNLHGLVVQADLTQTEGYAGHIASPFPWIDPNHHAGG